MTLPVLTFNDVLTDARAFIDDKKQDDKSCQFSDGLLMRILMGLGSKIVALDISPSIDTTINTIASQQSYAYPSDSFWWAKQGFIFYSGTWVPLTFDILPNIVGADLFGSTSKGVPDLFYIMDGKINFFPIPDMAYQVKLISEKRFPELDTTDAGIATTLALSFYDYFDPSYKDICWRYIKMMIQMGRNDKNAIASYKTFFDYANSESDWRFIVNVEKNKYQFNAKNRRAGGDISQNYGDYPTGGNLLS